MDVDGRKYTERPYSDVFAAIPNMGWLRTELTEFVVVLMSGGAIVHAPIGFKPTSRARNECVERFLKSNRSRLFFIDHDVLPPVSALDQLLEVGLESITGVVPAMKLQDDGTVHVDPLTAKFDPKGTLRSYMGQGVERIDRCGAGCWLTHRSVFEKIGRPWFEDRVDPTANPTGQDFVFCEKMESCGIPLHADFSVICHHKKEVDL